MYSEATSHHSNPTGLKRWLYSTNHKDIGTMYLIFAIISGVFGGVLSLFMRLELQSPGLQIFGDYGKSLIVCNKNYVNIF